jgi:hypothetical protein
MLHWGTIIRGKCLVMLVTGMLMACTPMGSVRDRTTDRVSTPPEAPAWSHRGSDAS